MEIIVTLVVFLSVAMGLLILVGMVTTAKWNYLLSLKLFTLGIIQVMSLFLISSAFCFWHNFSYLFTPIFSLPEVSADENQTCNIRDTCIIVTNVTKINRRRCSKLVLKTNVTLHSTDQNFWTIIWMVARLNWTANMFQLLTFMGTG